MFRIDLFFQKWMILSLYTLLVVSSTAYGIFFLELRTSRSSNVWQQISGYVGVSFGADPLSPIISSPSLMAIFLFSSRCLNASAVFMGADTWSAILLL